MKHPTPSDFLVEVKEAYVSVIFKPSDSHYNFGHFYRRCGVECRVIARLRPRSLNALSAGLLVAEGGRGGDYVQKQSLSRRQERRGELAVNQASPAPYLRFPC